MSARTKPKASGPFRRYPALVLLVAAAALAILLPSALNVPQSGPSTLAEFAPVPGAGQGQSDVSELGQGSSGGLGFGSGSGSRDTPPPERIGTPSQKRGQGLKRCVGDPPRQTEDPLSPPCVAFFEGDNGGATAKGVTKDEVTIVVWTEAAVSDPAYSEATFTDCDAPIATGETSLDYACKAFSRFFNIRYQTYGRKVHFWAYHAPSGFTIDASAAEINAKKKPFAIAFSVPAQDFDVAKAAAQRGIVATAYRSVNRNLATQYAPYIIGFRPDNVDQASLAAGYICRKLAARQARYAGPGVDKNKPRKFAVVHGGSRNANLDRELRNQCALDAPDYVNQASAAGVPAEIARMRNNGVTTAIVGDVNASLPAFATAGGWFPEWVVSGAFVLGGSDKAQTARKFDQAQWSHAFGITSDYRRDQVSHQPWYRAYFESCSECPEPVTFIYPEVYDSLTMLFWGIQAAGPRLTPENLDKGMHAIPQRGSPNPYTPAAYFSPGNYSFVKDSAEIWWDPQGQTPEEPPACYRLTGDGRRYRSNEWPEGDDGIQVAGSPCQASPSRS